MKTTVNKDGNITLQQVYNPLTLETEKGENMIITMRDSGFEFFYGGVMYFAKEGYLEPFHNSVNNNYLVSELQHHREESVSINN